MAHLPVFLPTQRLWCQWRNARRLTLNPACRRRRANPPCKVVRRVVGALKRRTCQRTAQLQRDKVVVAAAPWYRARCSRARDGHLEASVMTNHVMRYRMIR